MTQYQGDQTVTMGEWFVTGLLMCIPVVNIIMVFVWAFGANSKPSKANLFKLYLIMAAISIIITIILAVFGVLNADTFSNAFSNMYPLG